LCLQNLRASDSGVLEGIAPSVTPWIRHYYSPGRDIDITPLERQLAGGRSSWSRSFARLQIRPQELNRMGESNSRRSPVVSMTLWSRSGYIDILVEGEKISYGLHGAEFAALLIILGGLSPSESHARETLSHTGHLGHMHPGPRDPFSQIPQLDGSLKQLFETAL
jgi:hypothetical protein